MSVSPSATRSLLGGASRPTQRRHVFQTEADFCLRAAAPSRRSMSVRENLCYGAQERLDLLPEAERTALVDAACRDANILDMINDRKIFPEGFRTNVGEGGTKLSGGQKQRCAASAQRPRRARQAACTLRGTTATEAPVGGWGGVRVCWHECPCIEPGAPLAWVALLR